MDILRVDTCIFLRHELALCVEGKTTSSLSPLYDDVCVKIVNEQGTVKLIKLLVGVL